MWTRSAAVLDLFWSACYRSLVANKPPYDSISEREIVSGRALAAVAYLPGLCFIGLLEAPQNRFVTFHARQGLVLLIVEVIAWIALAIFQGSVGAIPVVGWILTALARLIVGLGFLAVTVYGAAKGASGELVRIPFLGDWAERIEF